MFLWFTNDRDGVEHLPSGAIVTFPDPRTASDYAQAQGLTVASEPIVWYDFERISHWCDKPMAASIDCRVCLDAWNLLGDLPADAESLFRVIDRRGTPIYDKLFFGNNLPSVTPPGESYTPTWTDDEIGELARILRLGLAELRGRLPAAAA